jgi:HD-like signal output (HDOD) protein
LPTVVTQLISLIEDPKSSARQVAQLISTDQALTAKILKVANSAFYGFPREISTVQLAIVVLGFEQVKNLSLSVAVLRRFSSGKEHRLFDRQRFWDHAIACGVAGRMLAKKVHPRMEGEAFVAGVLHDIGKLILIEYFFDEFSEALELAETEDLTIIEAEEQVLGVTHSDIGGWLAEKWNLPPSLVNAIAFHHRPGEMDEPDELVNFVHLANALVRHHQIGTSGDLHPPVIDPEVATRFKPNEEMTSEELLEHLSSGLDAELEKAQIFKDLSDS